MARLRFESDAPHRDEPLMQHYYNIRQLLKARVELTKIAQQVGGDEAKSEGTVEPGRGTGDIKH